MKQFYNFLVEIPDRLYFIPEKINGRLVFGKKAYDHRYELYKKKFGEKTHKYTLILLWRTLFHLIGSIGIILFTHFLLLPVWIYFPHNILAAMIIFFSYQEFYLHPRTHHQKTYKGVLDWLVWMLPFIFYVLLL